MRLTAAPPPPSLELVLTPRGHLLLMETTNPPGMNLDLCGRLQTAFAEGCGNGLLQLGAGEVSTLLPPACGYWRDFAGRLVAARCARPQPDASETPAARVDTPVVVPPLPPPPDDELDAIIANAPPMVGAEYLTREVLREHWCAIDAALSARVAAARATLQDVLHQFNPAWNTVGRVHFHLAEHRTDPDTPFAFLATFTHGLSAHGAPQHRPLGQALREYAGAANKTHLLSLLLPVQRAAEHCAWLKEMVDRGEVFHPLRWTPGAAIKLLGDIPTLERAGVVVRVPAAWKTGRPPRPTVTATVGARAAAGLGLDALLDFRVDVTLEGETLTPAEIKALLDGMDGLALLRGRWVEVDRARLRSMIDEFQRINRAAERDGVSFADAMRMMAGAGIRSDGQADTETRGWSSVVAGPWLSQTLEALRGPQAKDRADPGASLRGDLRPYQRVGVAWLHLLSSLGLGACLADDMGLGKTIQVLALLLVIRTERLMSRREEGGARGRKARETSDQNRVTRAGGETSRPSLLVVPASLLGNWAAEIARFAPDLSVLVAHPSAMPADTLKTVDSDRLARVDLVIATYQSVRTLSWVADVDWNLVVADEAQAIKNPGAQQTRALKSLRARARIAMTGTPIENRIGDLWSIFDFINPGLLGSARQFTDLTKRLEALANRAHGHAYGPLRELVRPYILRRLKTDRSVIADLPEKTEVNAYCLLGRRQAALYEQAVDDLRERLDHTTGIERRGVVLASLMRLKQICNHPSQWLGDGSWAQADSGKFARLADIAEEVAARQEKMLVFTQFREMTEPVAALLGTIFGRPGLVLHGGTPVGARRDLVSRFQDDERVSFFVLSLKAGGSGLNLTAASHVVHFDRWWNPAVEDQATDRAFRIGQRRNVLVHKFVCRGTVEDRIDEMIASKRSLAKDLIDGGGELLLTEMKNEDLLRLVALDVNAALGEE